jgi:hypothetical protein
MLEVKTLEGKGVIARSEATKQSRDRRAPYVPLDRFAPLAMTETAALK